jgi:DNA adenine methylase
MILTRLGNKRHLADKIIEHFPYNYDIWVEPFFGAGGMFFVKRVAKYSIVNDIDSDVYNLFNVIMDRKDELAELFYNFPIHYDLWEYWKKNEETDPLRKALRFLFLSNYGYLGKPQTLAFGVDNQKRNFNELVNQTHRLLFNVMFSNHDFRLFFKNLSRISDKNAFIYNDPPYQGTDDNYSDSFNEQDIEDLFQCNVDSGHKFAISEFNTPKVLELCEFHKLNLIVIGERKNIKNKRIEVLVTNYDKNQKTLF